MYESRGDHGPLGSAMNSQGSQVPGLPDPAARWRSGCILQPGRAGLLGWQWASRALPGLFDSAGVCVLFDRRPGDMTHTTQPTIATNIMMLPEIGGSFDSSY
jgi:hypothetical protein